MSETKPFHITADDVVNGLYDLAAERPGVYENRSSEKYVGCVNVETVGGEKVPSCIVGSYLAERIGIENVPMQGAVYSTLRALRERGLVTCTPEAEFILAAAQSLQDSRKVTWGVIAGNANDLLYQAERMHRALEDAKDVRPSGI